MKRLRKLVLLMSLMLIALGCKTSVQYTDAAFTRLPEYRNIPYSVSLAPAPSQKTLVVLPDDPDTSRLYFQPVLEWFYAKDYHLLVIRKPGEDTFKKRSLDSREDRIEDVVSILTASDSLWENELVILGCGEGAYLIPALCSRLQPKAVIMMNAGVLSPLGELEYMSTDDSLTDASQKVFVNYGLDNPQMLKERIANIIAAPFGPLQLAPSENRNWLSYYQKPLLEQLPQLRCDSYWINFETYPLLSVSGIGLTNQILKTYPRIHYQTYPDTESGLPEIEKQLKEVISKR